MLAVVDFTNYTEYDPERLAYLIRDALNDADCQNDDVMDLAQAATAAASVDHEQTKEALRFLCRALWSQMELISHPWPWSLRTAMRFFADLGAYDALSAVIALEVRRPRSSWSDLVTVRDGRLWIPDALLLTLDYVLEVELAGYGPGFGDDPQGAWAKESPPGFGVFLQRYLAWLGQTVITGFISHPAHWLNYPAHGVSLDRSHTADLVAAWNARQTPFGPTLVLAAARSPLAYVQNLPIAIANVMSLGVNLATATLTESAMEVRGRPSAWREEPIVGLRASLAATGEVLHLQAFRRLLIDVLRDSTASQVQKRGLCFVAAPLGSGVQPLVATVIEHGTVIHGSCLGIILLQAGRCIRSWQEYPDTPMNWSYQSLMVGGWNMIIDELFPRRFRLSPDPWTDADGPWLLVPEITLPLSPISVRITPDHPIAWYQQSPSDLTLMRPIPSR